MPDVYRENKRATDVFSRRKRTYEVRIGMKVAVPTKKITVTKKGLENKVIGGRQHRF